MTEDVGQIQEVFPYLQNTAHLYLVVVVMGAAAVVAIAGNLLVVVLFLKMKRVARLTPHIFLTNLALCDLILGLKLPLFFLVTLVKRDPWILANDHVCAGVGVTDTFAFRMVVAGMTAVAIDRYLAVLHAVRYPTIMSEKRSFIIIFLMWSYCLCWCTLPVIVGHLKSDEIYVFSVGHNSCTIQSNSQNHTHKIFMAIDVIANFLTPLSVMTFCYLKIAKKVLSPKQMGNTIKKFMRSTSRSLRKSGSVLDKPGYGAPKDSGIGIKVDNCESDESMSDDDYIELPAVTKHCDNVPLKPSQTPESENTTPSPVLDKRSTNIEDMYKRTGLSVTASPFPRFKMDSNHDSSRRGSWTEESAAAIKDSARKMSSAVTSSVLHHLKRISHASNAYSKMSKYQQKIARTTVVVYFSFFICFSPFIISQVLILVNKGALSTGVNQFVFASVCLAFISACINVIIYGTMHRNIKSTLRNLFT
ncbi:hypothetical protein ACHWQZ_G016041 [Mnemiopsis leidyi]